MPDGQIDNNGQVIVSYYDDPQPGAPDYTPPATSPTQPPVANPNTPNIDAFMASINATFPWLAQMGLDVQFFRYLAAESSSDAEVLQKVRNTSQYKQRFVGITRADGSRRMNEAEYMAREGDYKTLLKQFGYGDDYAQPGSLVGFFEGEIDPNELKGRLETYRMVQESGQSVKDAYYVYAGVSLTDDDLFEAMIDPAAGQALTDKYNASVALSSLDYATWIGRARDVGLQRVVKELEGLQTGGALTAQAVQAVKNLDPDFAAQMIDALYHGGDPNSGDYLDFDALMSTFEYAVIGAAASNAGLTMPSKERVAALRAAGVDRARAMQGYTQYAKNQGVYSGAVQRIGGSGFTQDDFERATFLGSDQTFLQQALAQEQAKGEDQGGFQVSSGERGQFQQRGLRTV